MPHTKSAKKSLRQIEKRRLQNRAIKRTIKTQLKKVDEAAESGTPEQLIQEYKVAARKLDQAASKRVIHPNLAARKKSQLAKLIHRKQSAAKPAP